MEDTTAMWIYFTLGCAAFGLALVSFIIGEVTGFLDDVTGPMFDWVGDHLPFGHDHDVGFSKFLNTGATLGFIAGFGFVGAFTMAEFGVGALTGAGFGLVGGLVLGVIVGSLWYALRRSEATSSYNARDLEGVTGVVTERIFAGGKGRVECVVRGTPTWHTAQAEDGKEIPVGVTIRVVQVVGGTLYVVRAQNQNAPRAQAR